MIDDVLKRNRASQTIPLQPSPIKIHSTTFWYHHFFWIILKRSHYPVDLYNSWQKLTKQLLNSPLLDTNWLSHKRYCAPLVSSRPQINRFSSLFRKMEIAVRVILACEACKLIFYRLSPALTAVSTLDPDLSFEYFPRRSGSKNTTVLQFTSVLDLIVFKGAHENK